MIRRLTSGLALLVAACVGVTAALAATRPPAHAPAFVLPARQGTVTLDSLRGKVVLVDFWASWCEPCRHSFPWMDSLRSRLAPRGFEVVAIDLDKDRFPAEAFLDRHPVGFPVVFDPEARTAVAYRVTAMPSSYVIGPDGEILTVHLGFDRHRASELEAIIVAALPR
jgi:thiol-disulfide isomerase/thioredoxin